MAKSLHSICRWTFNAGKGGFVPADIRPDWAGGRSGTAEMIQLVADRIKPRIPRNVVLGIEMHYDAEVDDNNAALVRTTKVTAASLLGGTSLVEDRTCRCDAAKPSLGDILLRGREHDEPADPSGPNQNGETSPLIADGTEEPPLRMFIIYAREDERWRRELRVTLADLEASRLLSVWHDQEILPGDSWDATIKCRLLEAQIILLLVSRYLLASHYIRDVELKLAMKLHDAGKARVVPVILSACDWTRTPLSKLQALPKNGQPVEEWRFKARAFMDIKSGIQRTAMEMRGLQSAL